MKYCVYFKGKKVMEFKDRREAETFIHIENTQMELAEYTPRQLKRYWKIRKVKY